jgi:hypothetical protein
VTDEELKRMREDSSFRVREKLDVGRRIAVYPMTWTADEARRWAETGLERKTCEGLALGLLMISGTTRKGGKRRAEPLTQVAKFVALRGYRPADAMTRLVDAKRTAKGEEAKAWERMDDEAQLLVTASIRAWNEATDENGEPVYHRVPRGTPRAKNGFLTVAA